MKKPTFCVYDDTRKVEYKRNEGTEDMLKKIKDKYHGLSLAKKFSLTSIVIIVISIFVLTVVVQLFFEKSVLEITGEGYRQKFDVASENSQKILEDGEKISKVLLTDKSIQEWFLENGTDEAKRLRQKLQVEQRLDYLDALYPEGQYSSISAFDEQGDMVNSNRIRSKASVYRQFFDIIKEKQGKKGWMDLYELNVPGYQETGIAYLRYFRDYATGKIKGYIMVEYRSPLLISNFTHVKYGETGSYLITDQKGNVKIENNEDSKKMIEKESYFQWALTEPQGGKVFLVDGQRCLVTTDMIPKLDWIMIGITPVDELTKQGKNIVRILYVVGFCAVLIGGYVSFRLAHSVTKPLTKLSQTMERFGKGDLSVHAPVWYQDEIGMLSEEFNKMTEQIQRLVEQVYREQKEKRKSELAALQAQINPHFLYNTLSSVSSLIKMNCPDEAFTMIHAIGMFYRTSLSDGKTLIPVEQEITNIENYIQIQKVRYGDKIDYEIQIDPEIYREWIVKLTLQPLVENSIYHGVKAMRKKGMIRIRGWKEGSLVYLQVSDNGAGIPEDKIDKLLLGESGGKRYSYGLYNIQQRIQIYFGKEYGLHIESHEGAGTCTTICIPAGRNEK